MSHNWIYGQGQEFATAAGVRGVTLPFSCRVLERCRRIDESSVEEDPSVQSTRSYAVGEGQRDGSAGEGRLVNPGQRRTTTFELFPDDPPPRFFDDRVTGPRNSANSVDLPPPEQPEITTKRSMATGYQRTRRLMRLDEPAIRLMWNSHWITSMCAR